jgi:hypothetical protein
MASTGEVAGRQPDAASHDRGGTRSIAATEPGSEGLRARVAPKRLVMTKDGHFDPYEIEFATSSGATSDLVLKGMLFLLPFAGPFAVVGVVF